MLSYQEFLESVDEQAGVGGNDQARTAIEAVLTSVAGAVAADERRALAEVLPGSLSACVEQAEQTPAQDVRDILERVAARADVPGERARLLAHVVLSYLAEEEPGVADRLRRELPEDAGELFARATPQQGASAAEPRPKQLSSQEVAQALRQLTGWTGDTSRLQRTVALPPGLGQAQLDRVRQAELELNHHASAEQGPDGTTFTLRTRSCDGVTELDVELARRIDRAVEGV